MKRNLPHSAGSSWGAKPRDQGTADGDRRASSPLVGGVARPALIALVLALGSENSMAVSADEYLFTPTVTQGERELDWHFGGGSSGDTTRAESNAGLAFGVGVTQHWFTEFDMEYRRRSPVGTRLDAFEG